MLENFVKNIALLDAKSLIVEVAGSRTEELADHNVMNLEQGKNSSGEFITPHYSDPKYYELKKAIGMIPSNGSPDLKLTGDFHEGIFAKTQNNDIFFNSSDSKAGMLQDVYGDEIYGVQENQLIDIIDGDMPETIDKHLMKGE